VAGQGCARQLRRPSKLPQPQLSRSLKTPIWENKRASARHRAPERGKKRAKSLRNKYFTSKSFKLKDLAGISS
jgi:hypothetical protein